MAVNAEPSVVLSQNVMHIVQEAGRLADLAYYTNDPFIISSPNVTAEFDPITSHLIEPDSAIVAKAGGYCFGAFRGTVMTWDDWSEVRGVRDDSVVGGGAAGAVHRSEDGSNYVLLLSHESLFTALVFSLPLPSFLTPTNSLASCAGSCRNFHGSFVVIVVVTVVATEVIYIYTTTYSSPSPSFLSHSPT